MKETKVPEFKKYLKAKGHLKYHDEQFVKHQVIIKAQDYNRDSAIIEDVDFQGGLTFDNTGDLGAGIILKNCKGSNLFVSGCEISAVSQNLGYPHGSGLILDNCQFQMVNIMNNLNFKREITIRNKCKIECLEIYQSNFLDAGIRIENSQITEELRIHHVKANLGLSFSESELKVDPRIEFVTGDSISFRKTKVDGNTFIVGCDSDITFNESILLDDFNIQSCRINHFTSYGDNFQKGLRLEVNEGSVKGITGHLNEIYIQNTSTGEGIIFSGDNRETNSIKIPCTNLLAGTLKFEFFKRIQLNLTGINSNANLTFYNCSFKSIHIVDFHNQGILNFSRCDGIRELPVIKIDSSDLGRTLFINFDFQRFVDIEVLNSIVSACIFSGGQLFSSDQLYKESNRNLKKKGNSRYSTNRAKLYHRKRELYKQFRHGADRDGDAILSKEFKREELLNFWNQLKCNKKWWHRDRLVLSFSWTNDMGLNWSRPIWLALGLTFLFYFPTLICASSELNFSAIWSSNGIDWAGSFWEYWNNSYLFLLMLNPARIMNRIFSDPSIDSNWIYFWDTFQRIILVFLIFQILTAFRKYIK